MVSSRSIPNRQTIEQLAQQFPEVDIASVETCLAFLDTTAEVYTALETHFARHGLSVGKFTLLMQLFVAGEQGLTPSGFAERAGVTRATITGLLDGLEREKLVQRQPYPGDRRRIDIGSMQYFTNGRFSAFPPIPRVLLDPPIAKINSVVFNHRTIYHHSIYIK